MSCLTWTEFHTAHPGVLINVRVKFRVDPHIHCWDMGDFDDFRRRKSKMATTQINQQKQIIGDRPCVRALISISIWSRYLHPLQRYEHFRVLWQYIQDGHQMSGPSPSRTNFNTTIPSVMINVHVEYRVDPKIGSRVRVLAWTVDSGWCMAAKKGVITWHPIIKAG